MKYTTFLALALMTIIGCTTMRPISPNSPEMMSAKENEFIRIHLKDGAIYEERFVSISKDTLKTAARAFPLENIQFIEKNKVDGLKTTGAIVGGYFAVLAIVAVGAALAFLIALANVVD